MTDSAIEYKTGAEVIAAARKIAKRRAMERASAALQIRREQRAATQKASTPEASDPNFTETSGVATARFEMAVKPPGAMISGTAVLEIVSQYLKVGICDIQSARRSRHLVEARWIAASLIRDYCHNAIGQVKSYQQIGALLCRDHATVMYGIGAVKKYSPAYINCHIAVLKILGMDIPPPMPPPPEKPKKKIRLTWQESDEAELRRLYKTRLSSRSIAEKMGRSKYAVDGMIYRLGLNLKPDKSKFGFV